jgi:hypothetical protein
MNLFQVGVAAFSTVKLRFAARLPDIPRLGAGYCVDPIRQADSHRHQVDAIGPTGSATVAQSQCSPGNQASRDDAPPRNGRTPRNARLRMLNTLRQIANHIAGTTDRAAVKGTFFGRYEQNFHEPP